MQERDCSSFRSRWHSLAWEGLESRMCILIVPHGAAMFIEEKIFAANSKPVLIQRDPNCSVYALLLDTKTFRSFCALLNIKTSGVYVRVLDKEHLGLRLRKSAPFNNAATLNQR
jgi:hypothetical protein